MGINPSFSLKQHLKKENSIENIPLCYFLTFILVEAAGVEPASEIHESNKPTSVSSILSYRRLSILEAGT